MPYRGGKKSRIERLKKRLESQNVSPEKCNLVYQVNDGILCLACALSQEDDFNLNNKPVEVDLDDICSGCGHSIRTANTAEASTEIFLRLMM